MRLQRRFLERAGHTVTIVAPKMHGRRAGVAPDAAYVDTPSIPITPDREYSLSWPGGRTDRFVDAALTGRPPVDVVHVQADFWGAFTGHRFAARHGLPVVHTMHNRVDVGIEATAPFPRLVLRVLNAWQRRALRQAGAAPAGRDGWSYLRRFAGLSSAVTAPSSHFARRLHEHGVVAADGSPVIDVWNGIDDDVLDAALAAGPAVRAPGRPRFVWLGRMSPEKRLLPFLEALGEARIDADVEIIGGGGQEKAARRLAAEAGARSDRGLRGSAAVRRDPAAHRGRRRRRADLDRVRDAGHDRVRGGLARNARGGERPRHRRRAGLGVLAGRGWVRCGARRHPAPGGIRHRQRNGARCPTRRSASASGSPHAPLRWSRSTTAHGAEPVLPCARSPLAREVTLCTRGCGVYSRTAGDLAQRRVDAQGRRV